MTCIAQHPDASFPMARDSVVQLTGKHHADDYERQGRTARACGYHAEDCPYFATSTAGERWALGWRKADSFLAQG